MTDAPTTGELSRQVQSVLSRFEGLVVRLDESFVSKNLYDLFKQLIEQQISDLRRTQDTLTTKEQLAALEVRVKSLENNLQWIVRIVVTFVVLGILGAVFVSGGIHP